MNNEKCKDQTSKIKIAESPLHGVDFLNFKFLDLKLNIFFLVRIIGFKHLFLTLLLFYDKTG